jgi:hypothetical protein
MQKKIEIE